MTSRILIVDDDPMVRGFADLVLSQHGYKVATAATSETALQVLGRETFALVLLDIRMPGMTGLDVLRLLRTRPNKPKILMMTGQRDPGTIMQAIEQGAAGYMVKPFEAQDLVKRVGAIVHPIKPSAPPSGFKDDEILLD